MIIAVIIFAVVLKEYILSTRGFVYL